ncbi:hypothetical protein [Spirulina major]|uniref:hypothetical protein n=1 Tax=Spirulina major TaxID=270636 RepID=UPI000932FE01|nr:hypothetical protein [Spirulina major]
MVLPALSAAIMITTFFAIATGFIFKDVLEYQVDYWYANRETQDRINYRTASGTLAYILMTIFLTLFMGECLSVFQIGALFAWGIAVITVIPTTVLIWLQLGSMLELLVRGGSAAIDLDVG